MKAKAIVACKTFVTMPGFTEPVLAPIPSTWENRKRTLDVVAWTSLWGRDTPSADEAGPRPRSPQAGRCPAMPSGLELQASLWKNVQAEQKPGSIASGEEPVQRILPGPASAHNPDAENAARHFAGDGDLAGRLLPGCAIATVVFVCLHVLPQAGLQLQSGRHRRQRPACGDRAWGPASSGRRECRDQRLVHVPHPKSVFYFPGTRYRSPAQAL